MTTVNLFSLKLTKIQRPKMTFIEEREMTEAERNERTVLQNLLLAQEPEVTAEEDVTGTNEYSTASGTQSDNTALKVRERDNAEDRHKEKESSTRDGEERVNSSE